MELYHLKIYIDDLLHRAVGPVAPSNPGTPCGPVGPINPGNPLGPVGPKQQTGRHLNSSIFFNIF